MVRPFKGKREYQPWVLSEALSLIRELQPQIRELGYHVTLGGGVLNTGGPSKDLDLFFLPLNGHDSSEWFKVLQFCMENLGWVYAMRDGPDYHPGDMWHYQAMNYVEYCGKRIDLFIQ